jgi:hypothetical protein
MLPLWLLTVMTVVILMLLLLLLLMGTAHPAGHPGMCRTWRQE